MKKCPFCDELIQDDALKCRYCKEWLNQGSSSPTDKALAMVKESLAKESELLPSIIDYWVTEMKEQLMDSGVHPSKLADVLIVGGYHLEARIRAFQTCKFDDWSKDMTTELGGWVDKYLSNIWDLMVNNKPLMESIGAEIRSKSEETEPERDERSEEADADEDSAQSTLYKRGQWVIDKDDLKSYKILHVFPKEEGKEQEYRLQNRDVRESEILKLSDAQLDEEEVTEEFSQYSTPADNKDVENTLKRFGIKYLYYMTPIDNLPLILIYGLLSHNRAENIPHSSVASIEVQRQRINVHDYVPLYFATHTPMQYVITKAARTKGRNDVLDQDDLVFIEVNAAKIFSIDDVLFTDGNAASSSTSFYKDLSDLEKLDWVTIRQPNEYPYCYDREWKRKKSSEVLVPDCVPKSSYNRVVFYSQSAINKLKYGLIRAAKELGKQDPGIYENKIHFAIDKTLYF